jgi:hypothetical protein
MPLCSCLLLHTIRGHESECLKEIKTRNKGERTLKKAEAFKREQVEKEIVE